MFFARVVQYLTTCFRDDIKKYRMPPGYKPEIKRLPRQGGSKMENQPFEKTQSLKSILENTAEDPWNYFEKYHIREVREMCLKHFSSMKCMSANRTLWMRKKIDAMALINDPLTEDLLSAYLFAIKEDQYIAEAIEYTIQLKKYFTNNFLSKIIAGKLLNGSQRISYSIYSRIPSIQTFILELILEICPRVNENLRNYDEQNWHCAERGLKIAVAAKDDSFLDKLQDIISLYHDGKIRPSGPSSLHFVPFYLPSSNLAFLKAVKKELKGCKK